MMDFCRYWMCQPQALKLFFDRLSGITKEQMRQLDAAERPDNKRAESKSPADYAVSGTTATIAVNGILLQRIPAWLDYYIERGYVEATSLESIRQQVQEAAEDAQIEQIVLSIHSPGGMVAGTLEAAEAIASAAKSKNVVAKIETVAASGAYYLASQAGRIEAGQDAEVGSIGVYAVYYDYSRMANAQGIRAIVISSGPHKGVGVEGAPITDEQIDAIRAIVDGLADQFIGAVARGRNMELSSVRKLADGRSWLAPYARELGLIDAIERGNIIMNIERNKRMEELSETIKLEEAIAAAKAEAAEAEMARMKALREAFPDDPQFAMEQFEKGADLLQAKAAYCDILSERTKQLAEQMKQNEKGKKQPSAESGAEPIPAGPSQAEPDDAFLSAVQQYQAEGLSRGAAIRKAVLTRPEAYESHRASRTIAIKC